MFTVYEGGYLDDVLSLEKTYEPRRQKRATEEWVGLVEKCRKNKPGRQRPRSFALIGISTEITLSHAKTQGMLQRHRIPVGDLVRRYTITQRVNAGSLAKTRHVFAITHVIKTDGPAFVNRRRTGLPTVTSVPKTDIFL